MYALIHLKNMTEIHSNSLYTDNTAKSCTTVEKKNASKLVLKNNKLCLRNERILIQNKSYIFLVFGKKED